MEKSELDPKQVFDFIGYQFHLKEGKVRPTLEHWQTLTTKIQTDLSGPAVDVPHKAADSHRKTSPLRPAAHDAHTMALEKQLKGARITRKADPSSQFAPPTFKMVVGGKQCAPFTPTKTCSANLYRHIKRRVGCSLRRTHCKGNLVPSKK